MHAESSLVAVDEGNKALFLSALALRTAELTPSQSARLRKVTRRL
jgi:hypothetical protein